MGVLKKIQSLPRKNRKVILWIAVVVIGAGLLTWWIGNLEERLKTFQVEELRLPDFKQELDKIPEMPEMPKFEMPEITEQELKKWEEMIREGDTGATPPL